MFMYGSIQAVSTMDNDVYLLQIISGTQWNGWERLEVAGKWNTIFANFEKFWEK